MPHLTPLCLAPTSVQISQVLLELIMSLQSLFEMVQFDSDLDLLMDGHLSWRLEAFGRSTVLPLQVQFCPVFDVEPGKRQSVLHYYNTFVHVLVLQHDRA